MKKIISIFAAVLLAVGLCGCGFSEVGYPTATKEFFVNDFADIIDRADEEEILSSSAALDKATTAQVVVVTVEDLGGEEISEYALNIGREWGVGSKDSNNGIVILLSREDREIYIAVGYGLEGALPDSKTGRIIDHYGLEYFEEDKFSQGITSVSKAIINEVYLEYGLDAPEGYIPIDQLPEENSTEDTKVLISWAILLIIVVAFLILSRGRGIIFFGGPRPPFGSGGGFGGSSGSFGGFRGGGGSFGGGGAGRGF